MQSTLCVHVHPLGLQAQITLQRQGFASMIEDTDEELGLEVNSTLVIRALFIGCMLFYLLSMVKFM